jgi:hypothetical protein
MEEIGQQGAVNEARKVEEACSPPSTKNRPRERETWYSRECKVDVSDIGAKELNFSRRIHCTTSQSCVRLPRLERSRCDQAVIFLKESSCEIHKPSLPQIFALLETLLFLCAMYFFLTGIKLLTEKFYLTCRYSWHTEKYK